MKPKSTLRSFLTFAGSSLLVVTSASAAPYYWDSNNSTAGFGTVAGTWSSSVSSAGGNGFTSNDLGTADITLNPAVGTTTSDDIFFGRGVNLINAVVTSGDATVTCVSTTGLVAGMTVSGFAGIPALTTVLSVTDGTTFELSANATTNGLVPLAAAFPYTGATTLSGTVSAQSIYQNVSAANFAGTTPTITFAAVGTYETAKANTTFPTGTIWNGAGTSLTLKVPYSNNLTITAVTNNAAQTILAGPGRLAVNSTAQLGASFKFAGGMLRMNTGFPYSSISAMNAVKPTTFTVGKDVGLAANFAAFTFTVDVPLTLANIGSGGVETESNATGWVVLNQANSYTGATKLVSGNLEISNNFGDSTAPYYHGNGLLKISGVSLTTLGTRPVVIRGGFAMRLEITSSSNTFTVGQQLIDNVGGAAILAPYNVTSDVAGVCGVTKTGAGTLVLSNTNNTYTGATSVTAGTLSVTGALNGAGAVSITTSTLSGNGNFGGNVTIAATGTHSIAVAATAGAQDTSVIAGTLALTAGNTLNLTGAVAPAGGEYVLATAPTITGTPTTVTGLPVGGVVSVDTATSPDRLLLTMPVAAGYDAWKGANAGGQAPELDFDNDGVDNGAEYFMDSPTGFTASPALNGSNVITWPNGGNILAADYGTQYVVQTSSDLSTWADVLLGALDANTDGAPGALTYTLTGTAPRFVRLKVTPTP